MKVVLTLGDSPKDCYLEVNGERVTNVTAITASVSVEDGPKVTYLTAGLNDTVNEVAFTPVVKDKSFKEIFGRK